MFILNIDHVNLTRDHHISCELAVESDAQTRGRLFRRLQKEYGRCTSKMYRDDPLTKQSAGVGWVFVKREHYSDSSDTYMHETWVHVSTAEGA